MASAENGALNGASIIIPGTVKNLFLMPSRRDHFQAGSTGRTLNPFLFKDTSWIPLVNWEAGDPLLVRAAVEQTDSGDCSLGRSTARRSGLNRAAFSNLRLWSVSLGRPMIFASAKNFAAIVSRSGKLVAAARLTPGTEVLIGSVEVPAPFDSTLYGRYGDWFAVACGAIAIVTGISERLRRFHEKSGRVSA